MTKEKFLAELCDILNIETDKVDAGMQLSSFERWDSLSMLSILELYDEMELDIEVDDVEACQTIGDILKLAGYE